ncbi:MAG: hypothetical protein WCF26_02290 [Candidatus Sulfotelmatobacter sp.]
MDLHHARPSNLVSSVPQIKAESQRVEILKRVRSIKTREQAKEYLAEVQKKLRQYRTLRNQGNNS